MLPNNRLLRSLENPMRFDKNTIIGLLLMVLLLIGFSWYKSGVQKEQAAQEQARLDSLAQVQAQQPPVAPATPQPDTLTSAPVATPATTVDSAAIANELVGKYGALAAAAAGSLLTFLLDTESTGSLFSAFFFLSSSNVT